MSNKIKQIIDKLQQSNNLIQQQRKEIDKLKSMAINNIVNKYNTESEGEMTEPVAWMASNELLFSVVKDEIYHIPLYTHPMSKEIVMNPDILPTLEEWRLICKMIKSSEK